MGPRRVGECYGACCQCAGRAKRSAGSGSPAKIPNQQLLVMVIIPVAITLWCGIEARAAEMRNPAVPLDTSGVGHGRCAPVRRVPPASRPELPAPSERLHPASVVCPPGRRDKSDQTPKFRRPESLGMCLVEIAGMRLSRRKSTMLPSRSVDREKPCVEVTVVWAERKKRPGCLAQHEARRAEGDHP